MIVRALLLLMAFLPLMPVAAVAPSPRWEQRRVWVFDYSGPEWQVQSAVAYFNAVLPKHAPHVMYERMSGLCTDHKRSITVCAVPAEQMSNPTYAGQTVSPYGRQGRMHNARILFSTKWPPSGRWVACHELTHAMGGMEHGAWSADPSPPPEACPYDATVMNRLYRKEHTRHR